MGESSQQSPYIVTVCSDSLGDTAESVVRAAARQFHGQEIIIQRKSHVKQEDEIRALMEQVSREGGFVAYTLVQPELREMMKEEAIRLGVRAVDIMGPMMQAFIDTFNDSPKRQPGLLHTMDDDYFRRMEAIEFTVKCDDGKDTTAIAEADIVLIGPSRTSKTPLSVFLSHKGYKVANIPLSPEVKPPQEIYRMPGERIFMLTMPAERLLRIREERLKNLGLPHSSMYCSAERIQEELDYAAMLADKWNCHVFDVADKAIEETANAIIRLLPSL
ncbi:pyruvate, water dikinase regulatory protein [Paenibacillus thiaminolyticus]|uniref:Putative pyruvate, phosphate dikinase regulatory protein n=1 Tax=Paenibacillus thiaminolyticus TaxID=49283 RepID=A0A3A3GFF3_PANTH|nr:pyruvate, water dikinase regulatory protein [Paenibacillus thiaminolyticus]RJG21830.1 kinase/pyrophosphorylase [Paenibacillus thiaminolyticus]